jgi:hypothetical protein
MNIIFHIRKLMNIIFDLKNIILKISRKIEIFI